MKYTTIYLDDNKIELFNTFLGKETVKVNGETVSEKRSFAGTDHNFIIKENENDIPCKLSTGFSMNGIVINLYKNNKPIIETPKTKFAFLLFLIIGAIIGYGLIERFLQ